MRVSSWRDAQAVAGAGAGRGCGAVSLVELYKQAGRLGSWRGPAGNIAAAVGRHDLRRSTLQAGRGAHPGRPDFTGGADAGQARTDGIHGGRVYILEWGIGRNPRQWDLAVKVPLPRCYSVEAVKPVSPRQLGRPPLVVSGELALRGG